MKEMTLYGIVPTNLTLQLSKLREGQVCVLTHIQTLDRRGKELSLECTSIDQQQAKVLLNRTVLTLDVLKTVPAQPLAEEGNI